MEKQSVEDSQHLNTIPAFWTRSHADGTVGTLLKLTSDKTFIYGVCYGNTPSDAKDFDYSIAAAYDPAQPIPQGFQVREIPARTWVVFECRGTMPEAIQSLWHRIYTEFFPAAAYQPTYEMDIEAYPAGEMNSPDYRCEIWVPVTKK